MLDTRKTGLIQSSPPSLSRNELYVSAAPVESKPAVRVGGASLLDRFSNSGDLAEVNSETVITVPRMVQQPIGGAFSVGDHVVLVAEAVGDNQDGGNAIPDGVFEEDPTGWTLGDGWSIASGVASCDGTQVAPSQVSKGSVVVGGVPYSVTFTLSNYIAGAVGPNFGATLGTPRSADGVYTETLTPAATFVGLEGDTDFVGDVDSYIGRALPNKQWQLDAADVVGATGSILVLSNIQVGDAGTYTCIFTNAAGVTVSAAAVVTVA